MLKPRINIFVNYHRNELRNKMAWSNGSQTSMDKDLEGSLKCRFETQEFLIN